MRNPEWVFFLTVNSLLLEWHFQLPSHFFLVFSFLNIQQFLKLKNFPWNLIYATDSLHGCRKT